MKIEETKTSTEEQNEALLQACVMPRFYCKECDSIYPCSTQNWGIKCDFEKMFEIKTYGKIIE